MLISANLTCCCISRIVPGSARKRNYHVIASRKFCRKGAKGPLLFLGHLVTGFPLGIASGWLVGTFSAIQQQSLLVATLITTRKARARVDSIYSSYLM